MGPPQADLRIPRHAEPGLYSLQRVQCADGYGNLLVLKEKDLTTLNLHTSLRVHNANDIQVLPPAHSPQVGLKN